MTQRRVLVPGDGPDATDELLRLVALLVNNVGAIARLLQLRRPVAMTVSLNDEDEYVRDVVCSDGARFCRVGGGEWIEHDPIPGTPRAIELQREIEAAARTRPQDGAE